MKKELTVALATLCSLAFLTTAGQPTFAQRREVRRHSDRSAGERWHTFTSPDGDFKLDFPREPKRQEDIQGPITLIRTYGVNTEGGIHFSVNFQDIGGDPRSVQNNEFQPDHEEIITTAARDQGRRVVQVHRLAKNVVEVEYRMTVEQTGAEVNYLERTILRRGRVYSLSCGSVADGREVDRSICRRFFSSMKFMK